MNRLKSPSVFWLLVFGLAGILPSPAQTQDTSPFNPKAFEVKLREDIEVIKGFREKLALTTDYVLMDAIPPEGLNKPALRDNLRQTWISFLDYLIAMDSISRSYHPFRHSENQIVEKASFKVRYWIFLSEYHYALQFVKNLEGSPGVEALLNIPIPELDLPLGTYTAFKNLVRENGKTAELFNKDKLFFSFGNRDNLVKLFSPINEEKKIVLGFCSPLKLAELKKMGEDTPLQEEFSSWVPLLKAQPVWEGKNNLRRFGQSSLSPGQLDFLIHHLEPGDILLTRRNCFFPGVGLPGYWSHAGLYAGDEAQRRSFFDDPEVQAWLKTRGKKNAFEDFLKQEFHNAYPACQKPDGKGHTPRVLEATPEGVVFSSLERFTEADSLAVLRPRLPRSETANAITRTFRTLGRPYDFNFDFESDGSLAGAELIFWGYKPEGKAKGLSVPFKEMRGNYFYSPNDMVEQFDQQFGSPGQQLDLVAFLEPETKTDKAEFNGLGEFRRSWKKPKWTEAPLNPSGQSSK